MRRGWKRSLRIGNAASLLAGTIALATALGYAQSVTGGRRHNELTLVGLRPGVSKLSSNKTKLRGFGLPRAVPTIKGATGVNWWAPCYGDTVHVEEDQDRTVQTITVSLLGPQVGDCLRNDASLRRDMRSGRGLELGDACERVTELYGKPESRSPSIEGSRKLELLFYSFDWAGEDVPQSMEISCDLAGGRVVEITLASSSL